MARLRFLAVALLALAFAGSSTYTARTQGDTFAGSQTTEPKLAADDPCVIYSLTDLGYDAHLGKWIAQTVPEMIEPSSWQGRGGMGNIRYYEPKNILLVKQTKAIQKKVDSLLKDLKASMPKASIRSSAGKTTPYAAVVPADYREPALLRASTPATEPSSYPVPATAKLPKHLFHFIIRYEGDGIIDDNVVKFMKAQLQGAKSPVSVSIPSASYIPGPPTPPVCVPGAPCVVNGMPPTPGSYAVPATPYNGPIPTATPVPPSGTAPSAEPVAPSPAPKKKKEKKGEQKKTTVTS